MCWIWGHWLSDFLPCTLKSLWFKPRAGWERTFHPITLAVQQSASHQPCLWCPKPSLSPMPAMPRPTWAARPGLIPETIWNQQKESLAQKIESSWKIPCLPQIQCTSSGLIINLSCLYSRKGQIVMMSSLRWSVCFLLAFIATFATLGVSLWFYIQSPSITSSSEYIFNTETAPVLGTTAIISPPFLSPQYGLPSLPNPVCHVTSLELICQFWKRSGTLLFPIKMCSPGSLSTEEAVHYFSSLT